MINGLLKCLDQSFGLCSATATSLPQAATSRDKIPKFGIEVDTHTLYHLTSYWVTSRDKEIVVGFFRHHISVHFFFIIRVSTFYSLLAIRFDATILYL